MTRMVFTLSRLLHPACVFSKDLRGTELLLLHPGVYHHTSCSPHDWCRRPKKSVPFSPYKCYAVVRKRASDRHHQPALFEMGCMDDREAQAPGRSREYVYDGERCGMLLFNQAVALAVHSFVFHYTLSRCCC
jgi:hypothetical protein